MSESRKLSLDKLTNTCDPDNLGFDTTADITAIQGTVGQERAVASVDFGLGIRIQGFNIYVAGRPGTGRNSTVLAEVTAKSGNESAPSDWCYVNNFRDPYRPRAIRLSSGKGPEFGQDMEEFIKVARAELPRAFESENYTKRKNETLEAVQHRREALLSELQQQASELGFSIEATPVGIASVPLTRDGKPFTREEYDGLPDEEREEIKQRGASLQDSINQFISRSRALEKETQDKLRELDREIALFAVGHLLEDLRAKYIRCEGLGDCGTILEYLTLVENDIVERLDDFRTPDKHQQGVPRAWRRCWRKRRNPRSIVTR